MHDDCRTLIRESVARMAALLVLAAGSPGAAVGQGADSVVVRPGPHYEAGGVQRALFGAGYRHLWTSPVRLGVLDLTRHGGGLTPIEPGGGHQTRTLHMQGADGRRYIFRSMDKNVTRVLPPDLEGTVTHRVFQDHVSANHPTGALVLPPLLEAAGVLHARPHAVVMPDDPLLGEYRDEFAGMIGFVEERPDEGTGEDGGFAGARRVVGTDRLLERLVEDPTQQVASHEYLAARLVDFVAGDTDRGSDQWRWAGEELPDGGLRFRPIPRDRDWAFIRSDGLLSGIARRVFPKLARYGPEYPAVTALTSASIHRDRQYLADVARPAWDSVTRAVQAALTDDVLSAAVHALPPEHVALEGPRLFTALVARRDRLPEISARFYQRLAREVDVLGSDEADLAVVDVLADGSVSVAAGCADCGSLRFRRRFDPAETREVRIYLLGGDDRAVVRAAGGRTPIAIRVIGGEGDDVLTDSSTVPVRVSFHDAEGENIFNTRQWTRIDRRPFIVSDEDDDWIAAKVTRSRYRDWGAGRSIAPVLDHRDAGGIVVGARVAATHRGFRRVPYAHRLWARAEVATRTGGLAAEAGARWTRENSAWSSAVTLSATRFDAVRFHGFGNAAPRLGDARHGLALQDRITLRPALEWTPDSRRHLAIGLESRYVHPRPEPGTPLAVQAPPGAHAFASAGVWGSLALADADEYGMGGSGWSLDGSAAVHPLVRDLPGAFGRIDVTARAYAGRAPTLALRAGAAHAFGDYPVQDAATLGGRRTLRGFRHQRFAGDAAVHGSAELRMPVGRAPLVFVRGDFGIFSFIDAGRVYVDGTSPGGWHTGAGAGVSFTTMGRTMRVSWARGEEGRVYLQLGGSR